MCVIPNLENVLRRIRNVVAELVDFVGTISGHLLWAALHNLYVTSPTADWGIPMDESAFCPRCFGPHNNSNNPKINMNVPVYFVILGYSQIPNLIFQPQLRSK
jgi:hypothetical protein